MKKQKPTDNGKSKEYAELMALVRAVDAGEVGKARELREFIKSHTHLYKIGDAHSQVTANLISRLAGDKASNVEFFFSHIDKRRADLGYESAGEVERMLIERIVTCWLRVVDAENYCNGIAGKGQTLKHHEFAERSLTRANNRFLKACEALERYRMLSEAARYARARADMADARAAEARTNKANAALRLLKSATG